MKTIWREIKVHLEKEKKRIIDEIINYPPPIPACDVQFNFLLEERSRITQELRRLREASRKGANHTDAIRLIREFIRSCKYIDESLKVKLTSDLEKCWTDAIIE